MPNNQMQSTPDDYGVEIEAERTMVHHKKLSTLRRARTMQGLNLQDAAAQAECGLNGVALSRAERGIRKLTVNELIALSAVYRTPPELLIPSPANQSRLENEANRNLLTNEDVASQLEVVKNPKALEFIKQKNADEFIEQLFNVSAQKVPERLKAWLGLDILSLFDRTDHDDEKCRKTVGKVLSTVVDLAGNEYAELAAAISQMRYTVQTTLLKLEKEYASTIDYCQDTYLKDKFTENLNQLRQLDQRINTIQELLP